MRSHAPMPSIDRTVARSSKSVTVWSACAMHSVPDLVVRACWNGTMACPFPWPIVGGSCGQPTDERSLATMPLTPPWLLQYCQSSETHHVHNLIKHHCSGEVLRQSPKPRCVLRTLQKRGRSSCLKVPAATLKFFANLSSSRSNRAPSR